MVREHIKYKKGQRELGFKNIITENQGLFNL